MPSFSITTAIPYTNARPHIGFAMELVQTDCLARYHRLVGDEVYFLTGTDVHGMKMVQAARDEGITPKKLAEQNSAVFADLARGLNCTNDDFMMTCEERHMRGAQKVWRAISQDDGFYKGTYKGLYCVGCEAYITEKDLVDGKCPNHKKPPEQLEEENYFFRYTKYLPRVKEILEKDEIVIFPASRKLEMLNLIERGIAEKTDISFSRPSSVLSWGVPVPDDPSQIMYVWCDALTNYITALGYEKNEPLYKKHWPSIHVIGKDILRFHAGYWPAMLLAAKIPLPKAIYVHGFVTSEGQKMSKSLGNVVDPFEAADEFGIDPLRYYLLREIPTTGDGDFSRSRFESVYNGELANNLGNLISRVITMTLKYSNGKIPAVSKEEVVQTRVIETWKAYQKGMDEFDMKSSAEALIGLLGFANEYIDKKKPWQLAKSDPSSVLAVLYALLELLRHVSMMVSPFMPATAEKIQDALNVENHKLYPDNINWGMLKEGSTVKKIEALFPRRG